MSMKELDITPGLETQVTYMWYLQRIDGTRLFDTLRAEDHDAFTKFIRAYYFFPFLISK